MMNLFQQANNEIFNGWKQELFINHDYHLENIQKFVNQVDTMIKQVFLKVLGLSVLLLTLRAKVPPSSS